MELFQSFSITIAISFSVMAVSGVIMEVSQKSEWVKKCSNLRFIKNDRINDLIGVWVIKWFVTKTIWAKANPKIKLENKSGEDKLKAIRFEMTKAELAHLIAFLIQGFVALLWIFVWEDKTMVWILLIANVPFNIYPALLQQQNKTRIDKLLQRLSSN